MKTRALLLLAFLVCSGGTTAHAKNHARNHAALTASQGLAGTTVLIVRHAEKPDSGTGLTAAGEQRARAYVAYFSNFTFNGKSARPDYLIAAADSHASQRPRLTIEPLSHALHLQIEQNFADKQFAQLASELQNGKHGKTVLIAWHHGEIPALMRALGVDPTTVLPAKKWPANVFGWVVAIHYNHRGQPRRAILIHENLMPDDQGQ
ncbi:MAG: flagellar basal body-associated protein FliL [Candidatus Eremiobacteraeota bacterium]|nr:flagellar basal body-associated protein FliL [Candidatus Eremiobacteraeota bacterium]